MNTFTPNIAEGMHELISQHPALTVTTLFPSATAHSMPESQLQSLADELATLYQTRHIPSKGDTIQHHQSGKAFLVMDCHWQLSGQRASVLIAIDQKIEPD